MKTQYEETVAPQHRQKPWVGFDLDGTLAEYGHWIGVHHIGKPVPKMVELAKEIRAAGEFDVKIFTARVSRPGAEADEARRYIQAWAECHLGFVPEIVCCKDFAMVDLYDDRCHQVEPNTGKVAKL